HMFVGVSRLLITPGKARCVAEQHPQSRVAGRKLNGFLRKIGGFAVVAALQRLLGSAGLSRHVNAVAEPANAAAFAARLALAESRDLGVLAALARLLGSVLLRLLTVDFKGLSSSTGCKQHGAKDQGNKKNCFHRTALNGTTQSSGNREHSQAHFQCEALKFA